MYISGLEACIGKSLLYGAHCGFNEVVGKLIELSLCKSKLKVLRTCCISCDVGEIYHRGRSGGKLDLGLFCCFLESLHSHLILGKVDSVGSLEGLDHPVDYSLVEVIAAQVVVTCGSLNFLNAVAHLNDGYIECTATQVVNHNGLILFLIDAVGKSRSGRLVDDTLYVKTCDLTCILCCLTLCVGEVCGNGDYSFCNGFAEICLSISLKLLEDHSGNFLRSVLLAVDVNLVVGTHVSLDRGNGSFSVGNCLTLCNLTNKSFACLCEAYNGRRGSCTLRVGDYDCGAAFHNCYAGVSCTKVNTNNL